MKRAVTTISLSFLLFGCATSYRPYSYFAGGGWKDVQLAESTFKVTFEANGYTSKTTATDMALLRSADLALANGFKYFVIGAVSDDSRTGAYTSPTTTTFNATTQGNTTRGSVQTYGGQTYIFNFPSPTMTISCFTEKPSFQTTIYDAALISKSMRAQYGIR